MSLDGAWRSWTLPIAAVLLAAACGAAPSQAPSATPSIASATATGSATPCRAPAGAPSDSGGPLASLPSGCAETASGSASAPRVTIADITMQTFEPYDALIFDFDRGLPEWEVKVADPPFTKDPSGQPLEVQGKAFVTVIFRGASIVDEEFQPIYEGLTDLHPGLPRIQEVVLAGDFEAVSSWVVGLASPVCVAAQAFNANRVVIAFLDAPS